MFFRKLLGPSLVLRRSYSQAKATGPSSTPKATSVIDKVTGLSAKCVKPTNQPVGPGAAPDGVYKVPEYFCFNRFSFSEAEVEMAKYRCPQPTAPRK